MAARDPGDQPQIGGDHLLLRALGLAGAALQLIGASPEVVELLTRLAGTDGVRSTETFLMPRMLKPLTAWVIPEPEEDDATDRDRSLDLNQDYGASD